MAQAALPTQQGPQSVPKPEMWFISLVKSKTMRFFAVSCEFVLFLGCLWLTLVTLVPDATTWLWGGMNIFFLVSSKASGNDASEDVSGVF